MYSWATSGYNALLSNTSPYSTIGRQNSFILSMTHRSINQPLTPPSHHTHWAGVTTILLLNSMKSVSLDSQGSEFTGWFLSLSLSVSLISFITVPPGPWGHPRCSASTLLWLPRLYPGSWHRLCCAQQSPYETKWDDEYAGMCRSTCSTDTKHSDGLPVRPFSLQKLQHSNHVPINKGYPKY